MLFTNSFDSRFTKTPNQFYDEILHAKGTTFNEAKLMGYIIRNTLGYNNPAAWMGMSRNKLLHDAQISYGSINPTIISCVEKGWILDFKQGVKGNEKRYLFLNNPQNNELLNGLEEGSIALSDLSNISSGQPENIISKSKLLKNIRSTIEQDTYTFDSTIEQDTSTSEHESHTKYEHVIYTNPEPEPSSNFEPAIHKDKDFTRSLKTCLKDKRQKIIKNNNNNKQEEVELLKKKFEQNFGELLTFKEARSILNLAIKEKKNIETCMNNVIEYFDKTGRQMIRAAGAVRWEISYGWEVPKDTWEQKPPKVIFTNTIEEIKAMYGITN